jgi:hypothetical protein
MTAHGRQTDLVVLLLQTKPKAASNGATKQTFFKEKATLEQRIMKNSVLENMREGEHLETTRITGSKCN